MMGQLFHLQIDEAAVARLNAKAKARNEAEELHDAAVSVLHDWRQYPADAVRGAIVTAEASSDGYAIQMARQVAGQINDAERVARNHAVARPVPTENSLRITVRHEPRWSDAIAGAVVFVAYSWLLFTGVGALVRWL